MANIVTGIKTSPTKDQSGLAAGLNRGFTMLEPDLFIRSSLFTGQIWPRGWSTVEGSESVTHTHTPAQVTGIGAIRMTGTGGLLQFYDGGTWRYVPGQQLAILRRAATSAVTNNTAVAWDTEDTDPLGMHSTSLNPSRITAVVAGWYSLAGYVKTDAINTSAALNVTIVTNGTTIVAQTCLTANSSPSLGNAIPVPSLPFYLAAGEYAEVGMQNNASLNPNLSGSVIAVVSSYVQPWVSI